MARTIAGDDPTATAVYVDNDGDTHFNGSTVYVEAAPLDFGEGVISNFVVSGTVAVAVPTIADAKCDVVSVDVAAAFVASITVGSVVIACPLEALPTDCLLTGAYVTATDTVAVTFSTKEGGGGVTGANKNFRFVVIKNAVSP